MSDSNKPLSELPPDADLSKREWSWYYHESVGGGIRHCNSNGILTNYVFPAILNQVIKQIILSDTALTDEKVNIILDSLQTIIDTRRI